MKIDIERLHGVADGTLVGRQQGHTFLSVTNLAALIAIKEPIVYCVIDTFSDIDYVKTMITEVFDSYELPQIQWIGRLHFECLNTKVFFVFIRTCIEKSLRNIDAKAPIVVLFEK